LAKKLSAEDIDFLVETLTEKDDTLRYNAFLLLQETSHHNSTVYLYWNIFEEKLFSSNSYQCNIGLKLISENVRWDKEGKFRKTIDIYLSDRTDEKFITARQAIQGFCNVLEATNTYDSKIKQSLTNLRFDKYKEHQQRLLKKDVSNTLKIIEKRTKP
jgi:hypothetical protein